ncbi:MAG: MBL fold metallo-hydrolase [bacterium]|nr:MBL fold metallo-hydrolase [bacterium]
MGLKETQKAIQKYLKDSTLSVTVLNVGDGDAIIIRFPFKYGEKACAVVDCYNAGKTIAALEALGAETIPFICATHPHSDHTMGMANLIKWCIQKGIKIDRFWDSGFRHVSKTHYDLIQLLGENPGINVIYPTSGYETIINRVRVLVLSPSIMLKNRYDTFGTNINNASIVLKLDYPPKDIAPYYLTPEKAADEALAEEERLKQHSIILGGDAQFDAWAKITEEFPELQHTGNRGQMIDPNVIEHKPLRCQVLKVPHHMSKHGIALEVIETLHPRYSIASCSNHSKHGFPHELTVMAVEDIHKKKKDDGMRFTGHPDSVKRSGTIVAIFRENARRPLIYGLEEPVSKPAPFPKL